MKNIRAFIIGAFIIILMGLACAVNTEAATVKYAKNVSDIDYYHSYILEAAEYPMSSTTKERRMGCNA